ncbi:hypothetical protein ABBQ38_000641 [Trebouxia sp. C0009 RCD-2024]
MLRKTFDHALRNQGTRQALSSSLILTTNCYFCFRLLAAATFLCRFPKDLSYGCRNFAVSLQTDKLVHSTANSGSNKCTASTDATSPGGACTSGVMYQVPFDAPSHLCCTQQHMRWLCMLACSKAHSPEEQKQKGKTATGRT